MKISIIALGLAVALPFAASAADGLSYNYAEADYAKTEGVADGWGLKGSYAVAPNVHVFADGSHQEVSGSTQKFDQYRIGVGFNHEIAAATDIVARAAYNRFDAKGGYAFNGYSLETGLRTAFGEHLEIQALMGYEDYQKNALGNPAGRVYGRLGGQVKLNKNWGIAGDLKMYGHGDKEWSVGPRLSW